jgi:hypothetical protein
MDAGTVLMILLAVVSVIAVVVFVLKQYGYVAAAPAPASPPTIHVTQPKPTIVILKDSQQQQGGILPTMLPPEQQYITAPDIRGLMPINVSTRGLPESYQQIGVLTAPGGTDTSASPTRTILPLFGRAIDRNRWNYYTRTDGLNPVQVPVQFKRRNCDDTNGCDEIMEGDSVAIPVMGQAYTASVYRYSTPRYLPVL